MMTSTIGLTKGACVLALLLSACGGSVETDDGGGGSGIGGDAIGGEGGQGGSGLAGAPPIGGRDEGGFDQGGGGEGGGGPSAECALMALVAISEPELIDAGGDLTWSPGESATFSVTLTNEADEDNTNYPGVEASSDTSGIQPGSNTLFAIFAGDSVPVEVTLMADAGLASGTEVDLVFSVTTLSEGCEVLDSVDLSLIVQ